MKTPDQPCCPEFDVAKWDKKPIAWENKLFFMETIPTFFHIPLPPMIGKKTMKMHSMAKKAGVTIPDLHDALILFRDPTPFKSEIYYAVTRAVDGANNIAISGNFMARVFDGPYNSIPRFIKEMEGYLKENGKTAKDYYVHYAYCPKCARKFGHNYMILFARV